MDPSVGADVLSKLIGLGIKGWSALDDRELDRGDVEALRTLLDVSAARSGMPKAAPSAAAAHLALLAHAFGRAIGRHQELHGELLPEGGLARWLNQDERERQRELALRVQHAMLRVHELGDDPRGAATSAPHLASSPLDTPHYRALWWAFSDPALKIEERDEEPPLAMSPTARREFERSFLLAYLEGLASPAGRGLDEPIDEHLGGHLGLASYRARLVRDLLVTDLATWGGRHVFGNVPRERWSEGPAIPFLPLDALYVEPGGAILDREGKRGEAEPLLALIERLTAENAPLKVIVVTADFGSGKSLSARMLARRWAERYLGDPAPSRDLPLPVHVRCAEDFPRDRVELPTMLQLAWLRQVRALGLALSEDDAALAWPAPPQRLVCLLDGIDEIALGEQHVRALFQKLRARTSRTQRFVVLARSGALPTPRELGEDATVVRIQPFDDGRIERWLTAWNQLQPGRPPVTLPALAERALHEVARAPLLLLLVSFAWDAQAKSAEPPSRAELYEHFFQQLARAKAEGEERRPIARSFEALRAAPQSAGLFDENATLSDAMLALLGHVAWAAHCLEQERPPEPLTRRHLENLLHEQAPQLPASAVDVLPLGLILAPQAELRGENPVFLFGHRSFREFLVGRHWAMCLRRLVRSRELEWTPRTEALLGGRLLAEEDRSFEHLMQIIHATPSAQDAQDAQDAPNAQDAPDTRADASPLTWSGRDRELLARWAQDVFHDEGQLFATAAKGSRHGSTALQDDQRAVLRETALAIGSSTRGSPGISAGHPGALRSMLAWFWLRSASPRIIAMGAHFSRIQLIGADLRHADLRRADLRDADLGRADLRRANLGRADLRRANLGFANLGFADLRRASLSFADFGRADLRDADLRDADLRDGNLVLADLRGANLGRANLIGANLGFADLRGADLRSADLIGADLVGTDLNGADLRGADLSSANLIGADLRNANLGSANFSSANLSSANLSSANLIGADLRRADLSSADLSEATLDEARFAGAGVHYDGATTWPDGFDPRRPGKKGP